MKRDKNQQKDSSRSSGRETPARRRNGKAGGAANQGRSGREATGGRRRHGSADGAGADRRGHASRGLSPKSKDGYFLFGRHAIEAALQNPDRTCVRIVGTERALPSLKVPTNRQCVPFEIVADDDLLRSAVPADAPHQGVLMEVKPLASWSLHDLAPIDGQPNIILMLDQVTDPHNVGACLRSAAALGARALITQEKNSPGESGTLARASSGGLEVLPWVRATNLNQALDTLKDLGYWHVGLDGHTDLSLKDIRLGDNLVIVMGSEGKGLRPLVRKHCDAIAKIPMTGRIESLNVSNAAAIALYQLGNL